MAGDALEPNEGKWGEYEDLRLAAVREQVDGFGFQPWRMDDTGKVGFVITCDLGKGTMTPNPGGSGQPTEQFSYCDPGTDLWNRIERLRSVLGYTKAQLDVLNNRDYWCLWVALELWNEIPRIIDTGRCECDLVFCMGNNTGMSFRPDDGCPFSLVAFEQMLIDMFEKKIAEAVNSSRPEYTYMQIRSSQLTGFDRFLHYWNWTTPNGKMFCRRLRTIAGNLDTGRRSNDGNGSCESLRECRYANKAHDETCRKYSIFHRATGWSRYEPTAAYIPPFCGEHTPNYTLVTVEAE